MSDTGSHIEIDKYTLTPGSLPQRVQEAFAAAESRHFEYGLDWLQHLAATSLEPDETGVVYVAQTGESNFVAWPMRLHQGRREAHALGNFYTSAFSPIVNATDDLPLWIALLRHLLEVERFTAITVAPFAKDSDLHNRLLETLPTAGWRGVHNYFCFGNWVHELRGSSFEEYMASRASRVRNTVKRRRKKFLADDQGKLEVITGGEAMETGVAHYADVYRHSWKNNEPYPEFIPGLLRLAAKRGWLRLGLATYKYTPAASQIWIVVGAEAFIFKLAYRESLKSLSPGTVLTAHLLESVIDGDKIERINYLSGDDAYKQDWMSERTDFVGVAAYNPRVPRGALQLISFYVKQWLKRFKRLPSPPI